MVIIVRPYGDGAAGMIETEEQAFVQQLVAHPSVEGLDIPVLHRLSRRDVVPLDLMLTTPSGIRWSAKLSGVSKTAAG